MTDEVRTSTQMAAIAAEAAEEKAREILVTMSTGAVVRVVTPKTKTLYKLHTENPEPKVPKVEIEMGGKHIYQENPDDPDYKEALAAHRTKLYEAFTKFIVLTSVKVVSLPESMASYEEDTDWLEDFEAIGLSTKFINAKERWLEWFFYRVAPDQEDLDKIQKASAELQGITEEQVQSATEVTFQDNS